MLFSRNTSQFTHILVLVDSTDTAARAVSTAVSLAKTLNTALTALSLIETDTLNQLLNAKVLSRAELAEFEIGLTDSAKRQLDYAKKVAADAGVKIETAIVSGNGAETIPREVAERGINLIVVGAFDSSSARQDILASQRQMVVDHAACPVLIAR